MTPSPSELDQPGVSCFRRGTESGSLPERSRSEDHGCNYESICFTARNQKAARAFEDGRQSIGRMVSRGYESISSRGKVFVSYVMCANDQARGISIGSIVRPVTQIGRRRRGCGIGWLVYHSKIIRGVVVVGRRRGFAIRGKTSATTAANDSGGSQENGGANSVG